MFPLFFILYLGFLYLFGGYFYRWGLFFFIVRFFIISSGYSSFLSTLPLFLISLVSVWYSGFFFLCFRFLSPVLSSLLIFPFSPVYLFNGFPIGKPIFLISFSFYRVDFFLSLAIFLHIPQPQFAVWLDPAIITSYT